MNQTPAKAAARHGDRHMSPELSALVYPVLRWLHIAGALIWIGHNWVNVIITPVFKPPLRADFSAGAEGESLTSRLQREHGTFR